MTATLTDPAQKAPLTEYARIADGARMIVRGVQRLFAVSLMLAIVALWFAPGSSWDPDVLLFKLVLSIVAGMGAIGFLLSSVRPEAPEVEIDTAAETVRLVRQDSGHGRVVLQSCAFRDLTQVERDGSILRLWDQDGVFIAEFMLSDKMALTSLVRGLRRAGKLT